MITAILVVLFGASALAAGSPVDETVLGCTPGSSRVSVPAEGAAVVRSSAATNAWFDVSETGHGLVVEPVGNDAHWRVAVPFRYSLDAVALPPSSSLRIRRESPSSQPVVAEVAVDCSDDPASRARRSWLADVAAVSTSVNAPVPADQAEALRARIAEVGKGAANSRNKALVAHLSAQALLKMDRTAATADAFLAAEQRWNDVGDATRARVARVGRVEELLRLGRHEEAMHAVEDVPAELARNDYFAARLRLVRCLALRYFGRMQEALPCFREGVANMERMGEPFDLVSAMQDMANVMMYLGDARGAREIGERALVQCTLPEMEVHRGRIQLMLADIALSFGDIGHALQRFDAALGEFAAAKAPRWEAIAMLRAADVNIALGGYEEASDFVQAALSRINERDAPSPVAAARAAQARIDAQLGRYAQARATLADVVEIYRRLKMPAERDAIESQLARISLDDGDIDAARRLLATHDNTITVSQPQWTLVRARVDAVSGACAAATKALDTLATQPLPPTAALERRTTLAFCLDAVGQRAQAQAQLLHDAEGVVAIANRLENPLLRQMLVRNVATLRRAAFRLAFAGSLALDTDVAWRWLRLSDVDSAAPAPADATQAQEFDAQVARELLPPHGESRNAKEPPRHLFNLLAGSSKPRDAKAPVAATIPTIEVLRRRMPPDAAYLSYIDTGWGGRLLWITHEETALLPTLGANDLIATTERLLEKIGNNKAPVDDITQDVAAISTQLLPAALAAKKPAVLFVDSGSPLAALPWPLLRWPNSDAPLIETTRVTLARLASASPAAIDGKPEITVFVAAQEHGAPLPTLWNARSESEFVSEGLKGSDGVVRQVTAASRDSLASAFATRRPWLHIAAHGSTDPARLGYSGIWLEPAAGGEAPQFVSWMTALSHGAPNELVVLNACRLAQQTMRPTAGLSFASAVANAGALNVVAGRWLLSDAATASWVPEFYRRLGNREQPGVALWMAQRHLRDSRPFRHPFYWASYVHFGRI